MNYSMHYFVVVDTTQDILFLKYIYLILCQFPCLRERSKKENVSLGGNLNTLTYTTISTFWGCTIS